MRGSRGFAGFLRGSRTGRSWSYQDRPLSRLGFGALADLEFLEALLGGPVAGVLVWTLASLDGPLLLEFAQSPTQAGIAFAHQAGGRGSPAAGKAA